MSTVVGAFHWIGVATLAQLNALFLAAFLLQHTLRALFRLAFLNRAVGSVLVRQVYFSAVQGLPFYALAALIIGSLAGHYVLTVLLGFGVTDQIGKYLNRTMLEEIAPIVASLLLLVRSGQAVASEVSLMKINNELETLRMLHIDPVRYVFFPRILAFALCGPILSFLFALVGLWGSFFILAFIHDIHFYAYMDQIVYSLELKSVIFLLAKPFFMALGIVLAALNSALSAARAFTQVPIRLIQAMTHSFGVILVVETLFVFFK